MTSFIIGFIVTFVGLTVWRVWRKIAHGPFESGGDYLDNAPLLEYLRREEDRREEEMLRKMQANTVQPTQTPQPAPVNAIEPGPKKRRYT